MPSNKSANFSMGHSGTQRSSKAQSCRLEQPRTQTVRATERAIRSEVGDLSSTWASGIYNLRGAMGSQEESHVSVPSCSMPDSRISQTSSSPRPVRPPLLGRAETLPEPRSVKTGTEETGRVWCRTPVGGT